MPTTYELIATTIRAVTDRVTLTVEADTYSDAIAKAEIALDRFPQPHDQDGVHRVYVEHRDYGDVDLMDVREMVVDTDDEGIDYWPS